MFISSLQCVISTSPDHTLSGPLTPNHHFTSLWLCIDLSPSCWSRDRQFLIFPWTFLTPPLTSTCFLMHFSYCMNHVSFCYLAIYLTLSLDYQLLKRWFWRITAVRMTSSWILDGLAWWRAEWWRKVVVIVQAEYICGERSRKIFKDISELKLIRCVY